MDEVRDGTWQVGDAGEVEFSLQDRSLSLTDVRPSSGWEQRVADDEPDEIEVHFTQGTTDWKFEVELDDGNLEISREQDIHQAEGGTYQVGDAAQVTFDTTGSTLSLGDVQVNEGWDITKQDESSDEIEIDFAQGGATADFEAELDDNDVELEISHQVVGPIPN